MLWEKRDPNNPEKRGYLYIRESLYVRDKRTYQRKPKKLGSGKGYKQRGKYTKKKDIYCGKIIELEPKQMISFGEFIESHGNMHYLEYKLKYGFNDIIDDFTYYLCYIYNIDQESLEKSPKKAYEITTGYLSKETITSVKNFQIRFVETNRKELERFAFRCEDAAIFDIDVIATLYQKIQPEVDESIIEELEELQKTKLKAKSYDTFMAFMKKEHQI